MENALCSAHAATTPITKHQLSKKMGFMGTNDNLFIFRSPNGDGQR